MTIKSERVARVGYLRLLVVFAAKSPNRSNRLERRFEGLTVGRLMGRSPGPSEPAGENKGRGGGSGFFPE